METSSASKRILPWLVAVAFFMESLDTTILNTAVPTVAAALHVAPLSMKSVLSSYTLSLAVFIPISGWMADRFGTRLVFSSAIGLFTLGSLLCGLCTNIHLLVACRILQGCGGAMMVPVGRLTLVRTFSKSELVRAMSFVAIPGLIGPMLGPVAGGLIVAYLDWRVIFFVNLPIGLVGLILVYLHLPDYREEWHPLDFIGLTLFGSGVALLSYVLEVFGEHSLAAGEIVFMLALSTALLAAYGFHATRTTYPLLALNLFGIRTFRVAVSGSFFARLGMGGIPFILPLLYQVGIGFNPIQSGLLMMPQALASMSLKPTMPRILARFGYRAVLLSNTVTLAVLISLFALIGPRTSLVWIVVQALCYGFFSSLQYTSMNTLVYSDVNDQQASGASSIASTAQQLSISFGVALASLAAALFIPDRHHSTSGQMIHGIHQAFLLLGGLTFLSSLIFTELAPTDGSIASRHRPSPAKEIG